MSRSIRAALIAASLLLHPATSHAQQPAPVSSLDEPIGPFVVDARGILARFKRDVSVAPILGVDAADLPTRGLGLVAGGHVYPVRRRTFALGLGGEILLRARASRTIPPVTEDGPEGPSVVTRMTAVSPQLSLNFGKRSGWSYLSGGLGWANITTELQDDPLEDGDSSVSTINYGGGARWFMKKHLALSIDLRFYSIGAQEATTVAPARARTTVMIFSAGISAR